MPSSKPLFATPERELKVPSSDEAENRDFKMGGSKEDDVELQEGAGFFAGKDEYIAQLERIVETLAELSDEEKQDLSFLPQDLVVNVQYNGYNLGKQYV